MDKASANILQSVFSSEIGRQLDSNAHLPFLNSKVSSLMSSMAWVKRCYPEKSKNLNQLLVFEALYP